VQTLEGSETFISVGKSVPIRSTEVLPGWHGPVVHQSTTYEDVNSGFYATARLNGDLHPGHVEPGFRNEESDHAGSVFLVMKHVSR
jgi:hypothetical protein